MIRDRREEFKDVPWQQGVLLSTQMVRRMPADWRAETSASEKRRAFAFFSPFDEGRSREFVFEFETAEECAAAVAEHNRELRERLNPSTR